METLGKDLIRYQIDNLEFTVLDAETEGLNLYFDRPWQMGWLECKGKNIVKVQNRYLWWDDFRISKGAAAVTKFNYDEYKDKAEDPKKVYEEFHDQVYDSNKYHIAHNYLKIDLYMINTWRRGIGLKPDYSFVNEKLIDTDALEKGIIKGMQPQTPRIQWYYKLSSLLEKGLKSNLGLCARKYGIKLDESLQHKAEYDIILNWEVFKCQLWQIEI